MSALGQKQTCAVQNGMSALLRIATAKGDFPQKSCPLYPRKETCAAQLGKSGHLGNRSITSLACASNAAGTAVPSALAVLRLIDSSYLVGACTGRSAGFSPLRIRST